MTIDGQRAQALGSRVRQDGERPTLTLYLTVLPFYRQAFVDELVKSAEFRVQLFASAEHCDPTVRTGIQYGQYHETKNVYLLGRRLYLQRGDWRAAMAADVTVLDLNPRCISSWLLGAARRLLGKRTLLWGHLDPRAGSTARTAILRRIQRHVAHGTILYGYDSVVRARRALPRQPVWVAPNALYPRRALLVQPPSERDSIIYVGRLEPPKKVDRLVRAFALSKLPDRGRKLILAGDGSSRPALAKLAEELGCKDSVIFPGTVTGVTELAELYGRAIYAVSPGYAGLSVTQALGFGVPILVSRNEQHAPEIELARFGNVAFFDAEADLTAMLNAALDRSDEGLSARAISDPILRWYTAEAMAQGVILAARGSTQHLASDGWPDMTTVRASVQIPEGSND